MAIAVDDFIPALLADEGWQAALDEETRVAVTEGLEGLLPLGSQLDEARAARLTAAVHQLGDLATALAAGKLTGATLAGALIAAAGAV